MKQVFHSQITLKVTELVVSEFYHFFKKCVHYVKYYMEIIIISDTTSAHVPSTSQVEKDKNGASVSYTDHFEGN